MVMHSVRVYSETLLIGSELFFVEVAYLTGFCCFISVLSVSSFFSFAFCLGLFLVFNPTILSFRQLW